MTILSPPTDRVALEKAVWRTLAYADLFDFPLTAAEIHRYLEGTAAAPAAVDEILAGSRFLRQRLDRRGPHYFLAGREAIVSRRAACERAAGRLWPAARRYGRLMAALPFVRLIAVTGSLAVSSVDDGGDIDYFVVTVPDRLWLCRALIIGLVRLAAARGVPLCPNYLVSERALALPERNLYAARELAQMVPLAGLPAYDRLRRANPWTDRFVPNAAGPPPAAAAAGDPARRLRELVERPLRGGLGVRLERWERARKIGRFTAQAGPDEGGEARFAADWCKGHFGAHQQRILQAFYDKVGTTAY